MPHKNQIIIAITLKLVIQYVKNDVYAIQKEGADNCDLLTPE